MLKILSIAIFLFGVSNQILSQIKIVPKDVEKKMIQNRNAEKPIYQNISVIYNFKSYHLTSREHAQNFDNKIVLNNNLIVKSCNTSEKAGEFNTVLIADGSTTADQLKQMVMNTGADLSEFKAIYSLNENVNTIPIERKIKQEVWRSELENAPEHKQKEVLDNPDKYIIIEK